MHCAVQLLTYHVPLTEHTGSRAVLGRTVQFSEAARKAGQGSADRGGGGQGRGVEEAFVGGL